VHLGTTTGKKTRKNFSERASVKGRASQCYQQQNLSQPKSTIKNQRAFDNNFAKI
jgi:hypothetical protein